ncbi:MAG: F0F1 ATP synthase subunit B [Alphaproteobacteria bacterium]|nr:F0F1 ATP synthase subunit B [Alphaproteobacteria bacterium]
MGHFLTNPETWVAVSFVIFVAIFLAVGVKRITAQLDQRTGAIKAEIDEARKLREEALSLLASYQRKQRDALHEAESIVAQAREQVATMRSEADAALDDQLKRRADLAVEKIARAEAQAVQEVRNLAVDVAVSAAERLIAENLDPARARALIDQAISDVGRKLN